MSSKKNVPCNLCSTINIGARPILKIDSYPIIKCKKCGLVYINHKFTREELESFYTSENYPYLEEGIHVMERRSFMRAKRELNVIRKYVKKGKLLDVGCAAGFFLKVARDYGLKPFGVDISNDLSKLARERYGLNVVTGTLEDTNFKSDFFEVITCFSVLEHVPDPLGTLKIMNKYIKKEGLLLLKVPNYNRIFFRLNRKKDLIWGKDHLFYYTPKTITGLLKKAGFEILEIRTGFITELISRIFKLFKFDIDQKVGVRGISVKENNKPRFLSSVFELVKKIDKTEYGYGIEVLARKT
jgi:2-polyprenyl-3-methyl-5-hydroxy-6-metoxy-1,4-benzoquinol methylase